LRIIKSGRAVAAALLLGAFVSVSSSSALSVAREIAETAPAANFEAFLDRLMSAESGGQTHAKNPRSSALGTFQFIKSTFLEVARRHFPAEVEGLSENEILELRTDREFARRAAAAFCRDNIGQLKAHGLEPCRQGVIQISCSTFADLRLAFLLGAGDAARILKAEAQTPASKCWFRKGLASSLSFLATFRSMDRTRTEREAATPSSGPTTCIRCRLPGLADETANSHPAGRFR
jgi:hypothetical protein